MRLLLIGNYTFRLTHLEDNTYVSEPVATLPGEETLSDRKLSSLVDDSKLLASFPSKSRPGERNYAKHSTLRGVYCTCMSFSVRKYCSHKDFVDDVLKHTTLEELAKAPIELP